MKQLLPSFTQPTNTASSVLVAEAARRTAQTGSLACQKKSMVVERASGELLTSVWRLLTVCC